jgi:hypothetical protein
MVVRQALLLSRRKGEQAEGLFYLYSKSHCAP